MNRFTTFRSLSSRLLLLLGSALIFNLSTGFGLPERSVLMPTHRSLGTLKSAQAKAVPAQAAVTSKSIEGKGNAPKPYEPATFTSTLGKWVANGFKALGEAMLKGCVWLVNGLVSILFSMLK
ncbi:MAG: hypothetical protein H7Y12_10525 [Sphingobacteriaceae bacterium]|nr:hypothetical protein [Cytophagaceae bacterium]